jgi:hypothetical protein
MRNLPEVHTELDDLLVELYPGARYGVTATLICLGLATDNAEKTGKHTIHLDKLPEQLMDKISKVRVLESQSLLLDSDRPCPQSITGKRHGLLLS